MDLNTAIQSNALIANVSGRLDFGTSAVFREELECAIADARRPVSAVIVDCAGLDYVSSAGLRVFLAVARAANERSMQFYVCALIPVVRKVFEVSGFDRMIEVKSDCATALSEMGTA